jgi:predicted nucleic acid-binding protein
MTRLFALECEPTLTDVFEHCVRCSCAATHTLASLSINTPGSLTLNVITGDPSDNRYLECAVEGSADFVVSGDRDLLALQSYEGIAIVQPSVFLEHLASPDQ